MADLAGIVIHQPVLPDLLPLQGEIDEQVKANARHQWMSLDPEARVELLADTFYRTPDLAVRAAEMVGYPRFLKTLVETLIERLSEGRFRATIRNLLHFQMGKRHDLLEAVPNDVVGMLEAVLHPPDRQQWWRLDHVRQTLTATWRSVRRKPRADVLGLDEQMRQSLCKPVYRRLLGDPRLVRHLAEYLQMAVPFSIAFARELDEIEVSRQLRANVDPRALIAGIKRQIAAIEASLEQHSREPARTDGGPGAETKELERELKMQRALLRDAVEAAEHPGASAELPSIVRATRNQAVPAAGLSPGAPVPLASPERHSGRRALDLDLFGVCFSGGGIRSATVNLGVLQGLASRNVLPQVDYLSTVSGGGYIGSWFLAWIKRQNGGVATVQHFLNRSRSPNPDAPEERPIRFLREYSNYLTPRLGLLGADAWTMLATFARNTVLNQVVLTLFLAAVMLAPRVIAGVMWLRLDVMIAVALWLFFVACAAIGQNLRLLSPDRDASAGADGRLGVQVRVVIPLFIAAVTLACAAALMTTAVRDSPALDIFGAARPWVGRAIVHMVALLPPLPGFLLKPGDWLSGTGAFVTPAVVMFVGLLAIQAADGFGDCLLPTHRYWNRVLITIASAASASIGALIVTLSVKLSEQTALTHPLWDALAFGPPVLVLAFSTAGTAQIGFLGRNFPDARREWASRLGAWLAIYAVVWLAVFLGAIYGPYFIFWAGARIAAAGGVAWVVSTLVGLKAGKDSKSPVAPDRWRDALASAAMYAFIVGLLLAISVVIDLVLLRVSTGSIPWSFESLKKVFWTHTHTADWADMAILMIAALVGAVFMGWRLDVNEFSMHDFYRNRLVRCYLGASRAAERRPNPFIGFDPKDDLKLVELRTDVPEELRDSKHPSPAFVGPLPVINTTLNLVKGANLAWQERRAASFAITPFYSGYELPPSSSPVKIAKMFNEAFRPTQMFAYSGDFGMALGTAAAISGAAASPNQGYQSSPAAAFLMTMFNARLGWWVGNPRREWTWRRSSPGIGLLYLLAELTGTTNDQSRFVNLSDGGHFDNLGLYELVRRRCRFILAFDAEQDGGLIFGALGNAVRKCRIDFGVEIDIHVQAIRHLHRTQRSRLHYAYGTITYPDGVKGTLVCFKASLTGDEAADVLQYADAHAEFPHQTTADQWFTESQFESYRALGEHMVDVLCETCPRIKFLVDRADVPAWFAEMQQQIARQTDKVLSH